MGDAGALDMMLGALACRSAPAIWASRPKTSSAAPDHPRGPGRLCPRQPDPRGGRDRRGALQQPDRADRGTGEARDGGIRRAASEGYIGRATRFAAPGLGGRPRHRRQRQRHQRRRRGGRPRHRRCRRARRIRSRGAGCSATLIPACGPRSWASARSRRCRSAGAHRALGGFDVIGRMRRSPSVAAPSAPRSASTPAKVNPNGGRHRHRPPGRRRRRHPRRQGHLRARANRWATALISLCVGGGQGVALAIDVTQPAAIPTDTETTMPQVAVVDIGKTTAKLVRIGTATGAASDALTQPNAVKPGPPYTHADVEGLWLFILDGLTRLRSAGGLLDAIAITTHGATAPPCRPRSRPSCARLQGRGPEALAAEYEAARPPFSETMSPRLPAGSTSGASIGRREPSRRSSPPSTPSCPIRSSGPGSSAGSRRAR